MKSSVVIAAVICAGFGLVSAPAEDCPALKRLASIDLKMDTQRPLVPVEIAGTQKLMLLAPGSPGSTLSEQAAADLKLTPRRSKPTVGQFGKSDQRTAMASMKLGGLNGGSIKFLVDPVLSGHDLNGKIAGVLGADILSNFDVAIDFSAGKMDLFEQHQCASKAVYWPHKVAVMVPFGHQISTVPLQTQAMVLTPQLDSKPVQAILDTGAMHSTLRTATAKRLFGIKPAPMGQTTAHKFRALSFGDVSISDPEITLVSDRLSSDTSVTGSWITEGDFHGLDLVMGMDVLRQLHIYIAYRDERLYVTSAGAAKTTN